MIQRKKYPVVHTLIVINVLMGIVVLSRGGFGNTMTYMAVGADVPKLVKVGEYWRWITAMFIHGDLIHLAFNMWGLFVLGKLVEYIFGSAKMFIIYFISGIAGGIATFLFMPNDISVGASGAVFGLAGAALGMGARHRDYISPQFKQYLISGLLPMLFFNFMIGMSMPNINNYAHAGGGLAGFACGFLIIPDTIRWRLRDSNSTLFIIGVISFFIIYALLSVVPSIIDPSIGFANQPMKTFKSMPGITFKYPAVSKYAYTGNAEDVNTVIISHTQYRSKIYRILVYKIGPFITDKNAKGSAATIQSLVLELLKSTEKLKYKPQVEGDNNNWKVLYENDPESKNGTQKIGLVIGNEREAYIITYECQKENTYYLRRQARKILDSAKLAPQ